MKINFNRTSDYNTGVSGPPILFESVHGSERRVIVDWDDLAERETR